MVATDTAAPSGAAFTKAVRNYADNLSGLLSESPWGFWNPTTWRSGRRARSDPELRKILQRLFGLTDEILRIFCITPASDGSDSRGLSDEEQRRILDLLSTEPTRLRLDSALEVFDAMDRLLIEVGDPRYICAEVQGELLLSERATIQVRWRDLFADTKPSAVTTYNNGSRPPDRELDAARNMLASLRRTRADDYQTDRARQRMRARNLHILSALLLPVVGALGWLIVPAGDVPAVQVGLVAASGATGSIVAGTIKARDRWVRGDLRAFRSGILAQVLIGAGSALFLMLVMETGVVQFGRAETWAAQAVGGFVAGFSEPFLLGTVERVAKPGAEDATRATAG